MSSSSSSSPSASPLASPLASPDNSNNSKNPINSNIAKAAKKSKASVLKKNANINAFSSSPSSSRPQRRAAHNARMQLQLQMQLCDQGDQSDSSDPYTGTGDDDDHDQEPEPEADLSAMDLDLDLSALDPAMMDDLEPELAATLDQLNQANPNRLIDDDEDEITDLNASADETSSSASASAAAFAFASACALRTYHKQVKARVLALTRAKCSTVFAHARRQAQASLQRNLRRNLRRMAATQDERAVSRTKTRGTAKMDRLTADRLTANRLTPNRLTAKLRHAQADHAALEAELSGLRTKFSVLYKQHTRLQYLTTEQEHQLGEQEKQARKREQELTKDLDEKTRRIAVLEAVDRQHDILAATVLCQVCCANLQDMPLACNHRVCFHCVNSQRLDYIAHKIGPNSQIPSALMPTLVAMTLDAASRAQAPNPDEDEDEDKRALGFVCPFCRQVTPHAALTRPKPDTALEAMKSELDKSYFAPPPPPPNPNPQPETEAQARARGEAQARAQAAEFERDPMRTVRGLVPAAASHPYNPNLRIVETPDAVARVLADASDSITALEAAFVAHAAVILTAVYTHAGAAFHSPHYDLAAALEHFVHPEDYVTRLHVDSFVGAVARMRRPAPAVLHDQVFVHPDRREPLLTSLEALVHDFIVAARALDCVHLLLSPDVDPDVLMDTESRLNLVHYALARLLHFVWRDLHGCPCEAHDHQVQDPDAFDFDANHELVQIEADVRLAEHAANGTDANANANGLGQGAILILDGRCDCELERRRRLKLAIYDHDLFRILA